VCLSCCEHVRAAERESLRQLLGAGQRARIRNVKSSWCRRQQQDDITSLIVRVTNAALCVKQIALPLETVTV
jgi:hypothetical protein